MLTFTVAVILAVANILGLYLTIICCFPYKYGLEKRPDKIQGEIIENHIQYDSYSKTLKNSVKVKFEDFRKNDRIQWLNFKSDPSEICEQGDKITLYRRYTDVYISEPIPHTLSGDIPPATIGPLIIIFSWVWALRVSF